MFMYYVIQVVVRIISVSNTGKTCMYLFLLYFIIICIYGKVSQSYVCKEFIHNNPMRETVTFYKCIGTEMVCHELVGNG